MLKKKWRNKLKKPRSPRMKKIKKEDNTIEHLTKMEEREEEETTKTKTEKERKHLCLSMVISNIDLRKKSVQKVRAVLIQIPKSDNSRKKSVKRWRRKDLFLLTRKQSQKQEIRNHGMINNMVRSTIIIMAQKIHDLQMTK